MPHRSKHTSSDEEAAWNCFIYEWKIYIARQLSWTVLWAKTSERTHGHHKKINGHVEKELYKGSTTIKLKY